MASLFADNRDSAVNGFQRNSHFAKYPRRNFTGKKDGGQHHHQHQGTAPLGNNTKSFTRPMHYLPRNSNTPEAALSSHHHGGSTSYNFNKPQAQSGTIGVAQKPKSSSSSLMQSAQRNRNISLILLLLATETVVSITQPHFLGNNGLANTGVCIEGAAGEWREVRGGNASTENNMRSSTVSASDGRPAAGNSVNGNEDGEMVMSELTMACRPPASSSSAHLSIELFAADRFQKFHDQFDNHTAIHTSAAALPSSLLGGPTSSVSPKTKNGRNHHASMSITTTSSIHSNKMIPTDERARSEGESDQETNDGASCSSDSCTTTAEESNARSSVEDTTNRKARGADDINPRNVALAGATPAFMMLMTESASDRMTSADDSNVTSSVCASSFASSTATPLMIDAGVAEVKSAAFSPESSNKPSLLSIDPKTLKFIFSFLSWREVVSVRGVSTLWFFESLNFAAICRMPASLTPAVFIPYPFQEFAAVGGFEGRDNDKSLPSVASSQSIFGGNTVYAVGMGNFSGNAGIFGGGKKFSPSSYSSPAKGEAVSWNNQTKSWRCAACGNNNSHFRATCNHSHTISNSNNTAEPNPPVNNNEDDLAITSIKTSYSRNNNTNGNGSTTVVCNTANPLHWNSERLFLGQLRRDCTIPFVLWLLRDVLGIDMSRILVVENHRDRTTGRGKGCAWVTVAMPPSSEVYEGNPCPPRSLSNALLSLHHRAFFDTVNGVEGLWITSPKLAPGLDSETSLRSSGADTDLTSTIYTTNVTAFNHMNANPNKNNHPRHMPRTSVVVEETSPQMAAINEIIGRHRNLPVHYVRELRTVHVKKAESTTELGEKQKHEAAAERSSNKISISSRYYETKQRRPEIRKVHNPYYSHVAFLANQPNRQQLAGNAHPPTSTTTVTSTLLGHTSASHSHTRATLTTPRAAAII